MSRLWRTDERTNGKWKIEQCSVGPETAKIWFVKQYSNCFVALLTATFNWWKFLSENICFQLFHANRKFPTYGETPSVYGGKPQHLISSRASSSLRRDAKAGRPGKISKLFDNINVTFLREGFRKKWKLRYESSTLILYKELSSSIFQSLWVSQASVTPVEISTLFNI